MPLSFVDWNRTAFIDGRVEKLSHSTRKDGRGLPSLCGKHELVITREVTAVQHCAPYLSTRARNAALAPATLFQFVSIHHVRLVEQKRESSILAKLSSRNLRIFSVNPRKDLKFVGSCPNFAGSMTAIITTDCLTTILQRLDQFYSLIS